MTLKWQSETLNYKPSTTITYLSGVVEVPYVFIVGDECHNLFQGQSGGAFNFVEMVKK